ncbi:MAG: hypothetical protein WCO25_05285 [Candidatus Uhrbacteria bacterium]
MSGFLFEDEFHAEPVDDASATFPSPSNGEGQGEVCDQGSAANDGARLELAVRVLRQMHDSLGHVISLLEGAESTDGSRRVTDLLVAKRAMSQMMDASTGSRTIEGVFNGSHMIGPDGNAYPVPPNYASKSRLVEGDVLKLVIRADGTFVFKQIGPVERRRTVGCVAMDSSTGTHVVICGNTAYKVLPATMSFYKADVGDEAVILLPKSRESVWAAIENVVKK